MRYFGTMGLAGVAVVLMAGLIQPSEARQKNNLPQRATLWQIGTLDGSDGEFLQTWRGDPTFVIGRSDPKWEWARQQPGPEDGWAGGRMRTATIAFGIGKSGGGSCRLVLDPLDTHVSEPNVIVTVDPGQTVVQSFKGLGVQWDPYDTYPPSPADWKTILARMDYCRPGYLRVMWMAGSYCLGFGPDGEPKYVWNEGTPQQRTPLKRLCEVLDYAQSRGIDVLFGEWGPPIGLIDTETDPRWPRIVADCVSYLRNQRGYKILRYYNAINEPNGDWSGNKDYPTWLTVIRNLHKTFEARGLSKDVRIIGPDTTGNTHWMEPFQWIDKATKDVPSEIGAWDLHWYAQDPEVLDGSIEKVLREKRLVVQRTDPAAASKPLFLGESGLLTGRVNGDQQPRVRTFTYGVMMADYVAQTARAGWEGALAWDLDDALHAVNGNHTPNPPDDLTLKVWGFWNSQGAKMGKPAEMAVRPWFYTWALMSRLFPKGSKIIDASNTDVSEFRAVAGTRSRGGHDLLTIMLVNNAEKARKITVHVPSAVGKTNLARYDYFENDRPADSRGFPVPKPALRNVDLRKGLEVTMSSRGVIFLTTVSGGK